MIDWTKPICLDTVPPRPARVVETDEDDGTHPYSVFADWHGEGRQFRQWCNKSGVTCLELYGRGWKPRVRNVRPGDPEPAPDLAAELAEALRALAGEVGKMSISQPPALAEAYFAARDTLAKWDARK